MNVHEYQAKDLLREHGVAVPAGSLATTAAEAETAARELHAPVCVVKAQVHAGGRGKAGGIKLGKSVAEVKQAASEILGMTLRSAQTGPEGKLVRKVYIETGSEIAHEYYLGIVLDRAEESLAIIASTEGGVEIEEVAAKSPEKILSVARSMYGARDVVFTRRATRDLAEIERLGYAALPVCIAKTPASLSDDPQLRGRPTDFDVTVREIQINAGAGFLVVLTGAIMRMPGLPSSPRATEIALDGDDIVGLD